MEASDEDKEESATLCAPWIRDFVSATNVDSKDLPDAFHPSASVCAAIKGYYLATSVDRVDSTCESPPRSQSRQID